MGGALLINPGSATGAYSMVAQDPVPSFVLIDINGSAAVVYVYELLQTGEEEQHVKVDKIFFNKSSPTPAQPALAS